MKVPVLSLTIGMEVLNMEAILRGVRGGIAALSPGMSLAPQESLQAFSCRLTSTGRNGSFVPRLNCPDLQGCSHIRPFTSTLPL
jgi:hypothetical protein